MIPPKERSTLTEAMVPPAGYSFDAGLATTYSLEIGCLVSLPLQLAWLATSDDADAQRDPIRVLEGLRRTASRLSVFVDRGRLHVPRVPNALFSLMEEMIHEVEAPHGGVFHPKVWVLRFLPDEPSRDPLIRLLILSRNLTDDRSWDLSLCLEGRPKGSNRAANRDLAAFVRTLPELWGKALSEIRSRDIDSLADDVQRCVWELPGQFEEVVFHILGTGKQPRRLEFPPSQEAVLVSPFVSDKAIEAITEDCGVPVALISRTEELALLRDETLARFGLVQVLSEQADAVSEEEVGPDGCRGLHAKAIVLRRGWKTHLYVGSANCTDAALVAGRNVEVMAELIGRTSQVGSPRDWISEKGLGLLLVPYVAVDPAQLIEEKTREEALERCRRAVLGAGVFLGCVPDDGEYRLWLRGAAALKELGAELWVWPLTVPAERQVKVAPLTEDCDLGRYAPQDVTSLTGFRIRVQGSELSFGAQLKLDNPPPDREAAVLALVLRNRAGFLRYLALLLGETEDHMSTTGNTTGAAWLGIGQGAGEEPPLFEMLVRSFSREPEKLRYVESVIAQLRQAVADSDQTLVPAEFLSLWKVFLAARALEATE
jgi:hypothetical protein